MPRVPVPEANAGWVSPSEAQLRAPDVSSGLGDLASGMQRIGTAIGQYADVKMAIEDMSAQTVARQQVLNDRQAVSNLTAQYATLQGQNAVDAQPGVLKQISDIQTAGQKAMPNPLAQKYYALHAEPIFTDVSDKINGYAYKQAHVAFGQQLGAETEAAQNDAANAYSDPTKLNGALGTVADAALKEAHFMGYTPEAVNLYVAGKTGDVIHSAIMAAKANKDYDLANSLDLKYAASLPLALRNSVIAEMAPVQEERRNSAYYKAYLAGAPDPVMDEGRNWIIPAKNGAAIPDNGAAPGGASAPGGAYQLPVAGGRVSNTYAQHLARDSVGVDIAVPLGTAVRPIAQGTVSAVGNNARSGNFVVIDHPDGNTSTMAHFGNVSVKVGDQVNANTVLGTAGVTGDATGPHVHLQVMGKDDKNIDPMTLLGGKVGAVASVVSTNGVAVPDEATIVARIRNSNLTQAQQDSLLSYAHNQMRDAASAASISYGQAKEAATGWVANYQLTHGGAYPPPAAVPASLWANMQPDQAAVMKEGLMEGIQATNDKAKSDAQGRTYADLQVMRYDHPDQFLAQDPARLVGKMTAGQWNQVRVMQAELRAQRAKPQPFDQYEGASNELSVFEKFNPGVLNESDDNYSAQRAALLDGIRARAAAFVAQKHVNPGSADWHAFAVDAAHQTVMVPGTLWGSKAKAAYKMDITDVPSDQKQRIIDAYGRFHGGATPSDSEIVAAYQAIAH